MIYVIAAKDKDTIMTGLKESFFNKYRDLSRGASFPMAEKEALQTDLCGAEDMLLPTLSEAEQDQLISMLLSLGAEEDAQRVLKRIGDRAGLSAFYVILGDIKEARFLAQKYCEETVLRYLEQLDRQKVLPVFKNFQKVLFNFTKTEETLAKVKISAVDDQRVYQIWRFKLSGSWQDREQFEERLADRIESYWQEQGFSLSISSSFLIFKFEAHGNLRR